MEMLASSTEDVSDDEFGVCEFFFFLNSDDALNSGLRLSRAGAKNEFILVVNIGISFS